MPESIHSIVRNAEQNYINGTSTLGKYVQWSMYETVERIFAYLNSQHISGPKDSQGRDKPFFNIVSAAVNIWYRATDIDRKDIKFVPTKSSGVVLAFVANILLQNWMNEARFGTFLNQWGRTLSQYGSAIRKFVERGEKLFAYVVPWNRAIPDPVDFNALPRIEKFYKTPAQLKAMATVGNPNYAEYDMSVVNALISAVATTRKTLEGQAKDNLGDFIEIFEVHGELDSRLLLADPNSEHDDTPVSYVQQMHAVSYVAGTNKGEWEDFTLYKGKEAEDIYGIDHLIEEDGRTLSIGAVEYLFDPQWMQNHSMKAWKDNMDLASRLVFQTADGHFVGRNVLSNIETGDILIHQPDKPLTKLPNDEYDLTNIKAFADQWQVMARELTSTPDAVRGTTLPSGTPYSLGAYLGGQANSLFEIMTENKGLAIEDMIRRHVIPHLKKKLAHKDEIVGLLDDAGVQEIDSMYVPSEAVRRYNKKTKEQILNGQLPQAYDSLAAETSLKQEMGQLGNKRFFKPDELGEKQWDEIFSDFEWDSIRVEVTNEQTDKQAVLQTLSTVLQTIATNPAILQDPNAKMLFSQILRETGVVSPIQLTTSTSTPAPTVPNPAGGTTAISNITAKGS